MILWITALILWAYIAWWLAVFLEIWPLPPEGG